AGRLVFFGRLEVTTATDAYDFGFFAAVDKSLRQIARENQPTPDGVESFQTVFEELAGPPINGAGQIAFRARLSDGTAGVYRGDDSAIVQIAITGAPAPGARGGILGPILGEPSLNEAGEVAFFAATSRGSGVFVGNGQDLHSVARVGDEAPEGDFVAFSTSQMSDSGRVAYRASFGASQSGLFLDDGLETMEGRTLIARSGEASPDGDGVIGSLGTNHIGLAVNRSGRIAFGGALTQSDASRPSSIGVFVGDGEELELVVRGGDEAPDLNGAFKEFGSLAIADSGVVAFTARLEQTTAGPSDDQGLFAYHPDRGLMQIARDGATLPLVGGQNRVIESVAFVPGGLNSEGQIAFSALFDDSKRRVFVVDLVWDDQFDADFTDDDLVSGADFLTWQRGIGLVDGFGNSTGDATADGNVDADDLRKWETQFGGAVVHSSSVASLPEASTGSLLSTVLAAMTGCRLSIRAHRGNRTRHTPAGTN
ncbi:MAG: choice-of-anchor tandem repeat NxxGxxAF-containing protein, partial [Planctomycetota bacterium]